MNVNGVYKCHVYVKNGEHETNDKTYDYGIFVKETLVISGSSKNYYIDLKTGETYRFCDVSKASIGEMYINGEFGLVPYNDVIYCKKENMSKRKILRKYNKHIKNIDKE